MAEMDILHGPAPLTAAAKAMRLRQFSPRDLADYLLSRIYEWEPFVHAFVDLRPEDVLATAEVMSGELDRGELRGPLHGVPIAVKDVIDVRGYPTRAGSKVTPRSAAKCDAIVVQILRDAGALIIGKTTTHEFAYGVRCEPTRNPWDLARSAGGSSGGSAAAVSAGECLAAVGTDTGGSTRVPSSFCGVSGMRPSLRAIPTQGVMPVSPRMDTCGLIAPSALDIALLYQVVSGSNRQLPELTLETSFGFFDDKALGHMAPLVRATYIDAKQTLKAAGFTLRRCGGPNFESWSEARGIVAQNDFLAAQRSAGFYPRQFSSYGSDLQFYLEQAENTPPEELNRALRSLSEKSAQFTDAIRDCDVLILPTSPVVAPLVDTWSELERAGGDPLVPLQMRFTATISYCGLAAVNVPVHTAPEALPIGVQFVARESELALAAAALYQQIINFEAKYPARPSIQ